MSIGDSWQPFREAYALRSRRLSVDLAAAWEDIRTAMRALAAALTGLDGAVPPATGMPALQALLGDQAEALLVQPVSSLQRKRPLQRALGAIQNFDAGLDDLVRQLPAAVRVSGKEIAELAAADVKPNWRMRRMGWRKSARDLLLRDLFRGRLPGMRLQRSPREGRFLVLLARACLHLLGPWQMWQRSRLSGVSTFEDERRWWLDAATQFEQQAAQWIRQTEAWAEAAPGEIAGVLLRTPARLRPPGHDKAVSRRQAHLAHWSRQQRAVESLMRLELETAGLAREAAEETARSLESLQGEFTDLLRELDAAVEWLQGWQVDADPPPFPPPQAQLVSAEDRVTDWARRISAAARRWLPGTIETTEPRHYLPGWRSRWRQIEPLKLFLFSLENTGRRTVLAGFREAEAGHSAVVREIERSREVVAFGMETARQEGASGKQVAEDAVANAISLLLYQKRTVPDTRPAAEHGAVTALSRVILEFHSALEKGRLGLLAQWTRQRGTHLAGQLRVWMFQQLRAGARWVRRATRGAYEYILVKIGLATPPRPERAPVEQTAHLGQILEVSFGIRDLPAIYRRLFRLAPVEDPRFLVGRENEMAGLADAFAHWQQGGTVAVMVIGARGSGKTSLLNCATSRLFAGIPLVSGQFCSRITSRKDLRAFLRGALELGHDEDLEGAISATRRVVILEEFERTFLCRANGFEALRDFLDLIQGTAGKVFWVLSTNEISYRFLDAAIGLKDCFTCRINATSVSPAGMTAAILQRHNLSGLRLEFAPLPEGDPRVSRIRSWLGFEKNPQELFFESLYRQSEGIFRSAFELWQDSIERVEGGVICMRQPLDPDYGPLRREMTIEDYFALRAILQHGSLTAAELAAVLRTSEAAGHRRIKHLSGLGITEPEPLCPGFRVRPQAGRFVRDALHSQNLL